MQFSIGFLESFSCVYSFVCVCHFLEPFPSNLDWRSSTFSHSRFIIWLCKILMAECILTASPPFSSWELACATARHMLEEQAIHIAHIICCLFIFVLCIADFLMNEINHEKVMQDGLHFLLKDVEVHCQRSDKN